MNTTARLSAYGAALALLVTGAIAVGTAVGPLSGPAPEGAGHGDAHSGTVAEPAERADGTVVDPAERADGSVAEPAERADVSGDGTSGAEPGGLASTRGGYTLTPTAATLTAGIPGTFAFRIVGPDGAAVTGFDVAHEKRMHLVVVRRDAAGFQHLHPEMAADGTWSVPLTLPAGGSYRAFADFDPVGGEARTLGTDVSVPGDFAPVGHPTSRTAQVDGYTVTLSGDLVPGQASPVTLTASRDGRPVTDLQPYLGAYGHLVALRAGDLAYLHTHPEGSPDDGATPAGPEIGFVAEVPSAGTYRLFLDFRHGDVVRTAEFTVPTAAAAPDAAPAPAHGTGGH